MYDPFAPNRLTRTVDPAALISTSDMKDFLRVDISDDDARRKGDVLRVGDLAELRAPRATWATDAAGTQTGGDSWRWRPDDVRAVR